MIVDLFAGPGGWDTGVRMAGYDGPLLGVELEPWACATAEAAGHARLCADVSTLPTDIFTGVDGLIASPPCQTFSRAGNRKGTADPRGELVYQPLRWIKALMPRWVACEQVPDVLPIWQETAYQIRPLGYSTWTGLLLAADYGVPQTRLRAFLIARLDGIAAPPPATHSKDAHGTDLFGGNVLPWVSMADALGWGLEDRPAWTVTGGGTENGGAEVFGNAKCREKLRMMAAGRTGLALPRDPGRDPSDTITGKGTAAWVYVNGNQANAARRPATAPAPTVHFGAASNDVRWYFDRPSTTVQSTNRIGKPGHKNWENGESQFEQDSVRVSVEEAAILQGFPPGYPWQGSKTKCYEQVGNAVPPPLAAAVVAPLLNRGVA